MVLTKWLRFSCLFVLGLFFADTLVARSNTDSSELFPMPEALKPNVEFWTNVYAKYSETEVIIHDAEDLDVVYEVVDLNSLFKGVEVSHRLQWKKIALIKKEYQSALRKLSRKKNPNVAALRGKEKLVAELFKNQFTAKRLRRAAKNVRGQSGLKERFRRGLERSGLYLDKMEEIFTRAGLPLELLVMPHVESSFNYKAYSKFGAAGLWQFTRSTGRRYMKINYAVDERLDPMIATENAAKHIKKNYEVLESWPLAITAYNHGRQGMKRARKRFGDDIATIVRSYKSRSFGFASRNFYSEFLAALQITKNYKQYFGEIAFQEPRDYLIFETPDFISVKTLLSHADISVEEFADFNPALRRPVLSSKRRIPRNFRIRIPIIEGLDMSEVYARISSKFKFDSQVRPDWHKVRSGERLSVIARKYRVSLSDLMDLNSLRNPHLIFVGQSLQIPSERASQQAPARLVVKIEKSRQFAEATNLKESDSPTTTDVPRTIALTRGNDVKSIVEKKPAETRIDLIPMISEANLVPAEPKTLIPDNEVSKRELDLVKVQKVEVRIASLEADMAMALPNHYVEVTKDMQTRVVRMPHNESKRRPFRGLAFPQNGQVRIEPDETLGHFADWLKVPTQRIRAINRLAYDQQIRIGQPLLLAFEKVTPEEFHGRRLEYHQGIEEDFYRNFAVEGEKVYKINAGENIWYLCLQVFEMPYWLVKKYNPDRELVHLRVGDELAIPIVERKVASD